MDERGSCNESNNIFCLKKFGPQHHLACRLLKHDLCFPGQAKNVRTHPTKTKKRHVRLRCSVLHAGTHVCSLRIRLASRRSTRRPGPSSILRRARAPPARRCILGLSPEGLVGKSCPDTVCCHLRQINAGRGKEAHPCCLLQSFLEADTSIVSWHPCHLDHDVGCFSVPATMLAELTTQLVGCRSRTDFSGNLLLTMVSCRTLRLSD